MAGPKILPQKIGSSSFARAFIARLKIQKKTYLELDGRKADDFGNPYLSQNYFTTSIWFYFQAKNLHIYSTEPLAGCKTIVG